MKTNKDKSTEIFPPFLLCICARALPRAKKGQQKVEISKNTESLWPLLELLLFALPGLHQLNRKYSNMLRITTSSVKVTWIMTLLIVLK